jgi:aspartyl-tRNA(Asn)/glutamyl-tRNA(Gln) amidotransferase subunit A
MTDLHHLTIAEAGRLFRSGDLSPVELTRAYLDRIDRLDGDLHTYLTVTAERALDEAATAACELAGGIDRGPMHGIPYGLKDAYETAGIRTTGHSKVLEHHVPTRDAEAQRRLRAGGGVLLGKHSLWEFTFGGPSYDQPWPPALNPWDRTKALMGSSTGSGAAVAAGLCAGAMGSDTGGSIRSPAALCGIAGLKPTYGRVSRAGILPNTFSFDHAGPMAWTVEDCALMLQTVAGHDPADPASVDEPVDDYVAAIERPLTGVRIGLIRDWYTEEGSVSADTGAALDAAAAVFEDLGCDVTELRSSAPGAPVPTMREFLDCKIPITLAEIYAAFEPYLRERPGDFGRQFRYRIISGFLVSGPDYVQALRWRTDLARRMLANFARDSGSGVDLMLTAGHLGSPPPVNPDAPPAILNAATPSVTTPFNLTGQPALALCCGFEADGFPIGMQIAGRPFDESLVLAAGHAYEQATSWRQRRPQL